MSPIVVLLPTQRLLVALSLLLALATGCDDPFGRKTDTSYITPPDTAAQQVAYVPVFPFLTGIQQPTQILTGNDELLYVVESGSSRLLCYDQAGRQMGSLRIPGLTTVAQDRTLDLLALGRDSINVGTVAEPRFNFLTTIYRIGLKNAVYGLSQAVIKKKITHPFYFASSVSASPRATEVSFNGITILPDNRYLVTRSGPGADLLTGNPDDAVLLFSPTDQFISPISLTGDGGGSISDFFKTPFAIASVPPRSLIISPTDVSDFLVSTLGSSDSVLRVRYVSVDVSPEGVNYNVRQLAASGDTLARGFIYQAGRFKAPQGLAIAGDETGFLFVSDTRTDSVYQFTADGLEGVQLRASQVNRRYNKVSFGGQGSGPYQFQDPQGLAYRNRILYVADKGNNRVCRYKLTTDFE